MSVLVPPASVDFVAKVWENFHETIMPMLGAEARQAVISNKDPLEMGNFEALKIQTVILESVYSK
jgi:hypothetical protein